MTYEVRYLTVYGKYAEPFPTKAEADSYAKKLKELNKQPGYLAAGIRVEQVA